jgi:Fe-S oxidoreductase
LQDAGFHVVFPSAHVCCGRPLYDFGMLKTAKKYLLRTLDVLAPHLEQGTPIVVLEPSCASVFRDELLNLLPNDPRSPRLAAQTHLLSEFLANFAPHYTPPRRSAEEKIIVHGHCHQKSECGMQAELNLLRATGASVELLDSGCCGMAGPFGFEHDKYEVSQAIANRRLMPAVAANPAATLCIDGFSCRQQVTQGSAAHPLHLAEILAQGSESPRRS